METNEINYEAVLKDLHLRRDAIEKAIDSISKLISGGFASSTRKIPKDELAELYHGQGLSVEEIAVKTGKSPSGVRVQLKKNKIPIRPRGTAGRAMKAASHNFQKPSAADSNKETVLKLFGEGRTVPQIQEKTGIDAKTINRILEEPRQPSERSSQGKIKTLKEMGPEEHAKMRQLYGNNCESKF